MRRSSIWSCLRINEHVRNCILFLGRCQVTCGKIQFSTFYNPFQNQEFAICITTNSKQILRLLHRMAWTSLARNFVTSQQSLLCNSRRHFQVHNLKTFVKSFVKRIVNSFPLKHQSLFIPITACWKHHRKSTLLSIASYR